MTEEEERDNNHNQNNTNNNNNTKDKKKREFVIKIPSYEQVINGGGGGLSSNSNPSSLLFKPSQSFSQAFSSVKHSQYYSPPPPPSSGQLGKSETITSSSSSSSYGFGQNRNTILVSNRQIGNPLLKHIRNVKWVFANIGCDYLLGQSTCALYLSLRYHLLHPDYLYFRIRELQKTFKLSVVLCHVDVEDVVKPLLEVTKTSMLHDCTLLCAWSLEECGRYLETIKVYENKPADIIQGQTDTDYLSRLTHALTSVRHVNKTDVVTLGSTFGSLSHVMDASMEDLARCPGIGERKVKRLYDTFHEPFKRVIPKNISVPEITSQNNPKPFHVNEEKSEVIGDKSKLRNLVPEVTVKSALSTAFSKYSHKIGPRKQQEKLEGPSSSAEAKGKSGSSEEKAS